MHNIIARFSSKFRLTSTVVLLALLALFASTYTHAQQPSEDGAGTVTEPLGETFNEPKTLAPNVARIIFYRPTHGYVEGEASLQVNGHSYVSLQFVGYSELCLPPGAPLENYRDATTALPIQAGDNRASITPDRADIAHPAIGAGSAQPVITTYGKTATPEAIECSKPNRRVVVNAQATAL